MQSEYIDAVSRQITDTAARKAVREELTAHLCDKRDYYIDLGYDEDEALRRAEADMGEPDDCAVPLNTLHRKGNRKGLSAIAVGFELLFLAVAIWFSNIFCYGSEHLLAIFHSIGVDFLSFGFIAGFAVILMRAHMRKKKSIAASVIVTLALYLLISLLNSGTQSLFGLFQPALYAGFTLITKGLGGYADRIFAYQYTPWEEKPVFVTGAAVIFAVLLLWAVYLFAAIHLQERLHRTKVLQRILKGVQAAVGVLLCANFLLMATGTVAAAIDLPNKRATAAEEKKQLIDSILYCDDSVDFALPEEINTSYLPYYGIDNTVDYQRQSYNRNTATNNTLFTAGMKTNAQFSSLTYGFSVTNFNTELPLISGNIRITQYERQQLKDVETLDDFLKLAWYGKVVSVMRTHSEINSASNGDSLHVDTITFTYLTDENNAKTYTFSKDDGKNFYFVHQYQKDTTTDSYSSVIPTEMF